MKKTISINLQGILFYLEDDGYEALSRYLQEVKAHFASYQGHEEIVADIEGRIAELFSARLSATRQVITLADVEELTAQMGRVSDFNTSPDEDEEFAYAAASSNFERNAQAGASPAGTAADAAPRRLYRDLTHRKIAGVCAGLGQYFMVNPLLFRVLGLVLVLLPLFFGHRFPMPGFGFNRSFDLGGLVLVAYAILWIVLPKRTDAPTPIDTLDLGGPLRGRKLFRDTVTGKVGGVAAGLAAYFQTDVVLVRVLLLLGLFLGGSTFVLYLILWAVVPEARTVSEKMQMRGDDVTLSGIDSSLRASAFDGDTTPPAGQRPVGTFLEGAARGAQPTLGFLGKLIRWAVGALLVFWGGSWLVSVLLMLGAALSIIPFTAVEHTSNGFMFDDSFGALVRNLPPWGAVAGALAAGIPGLALILLGLRLLLRRSVAGRSAGLLTGLWVLGLLGSFAAGMQVARDFQSRGTYTTTQRFDEVLSGPGIVLDARNVENHFKWVDVAVAPADSNAAPYAEKEYQAHGRTEDAARLTAQQSLNYAITQRDSTITFDQGFTLRDSAPFRNQQLHVKLYLPLNKIYRLTPLFVEHLEDRDFVGGNRPDDNQTHRARFTREGQFRCLDCPPAKNDDNDDDDNDEAVSLDVNGVRTRVRVNTDGDEPTVSVRTDGDESFSFSPSHYGSARKSLTNPGAFTEIEVRSALQVVVRQGDAYKVEAAGRTSDLDDVRLAVEGDRLVLRQRSTGLFSSRARAVLVTVTLPRLRHLELHEASQVDVSGFRNDDLRLEASGASQARLDVQVPRLELDLSGASQAHLNGTATELAVESGSASQVAARDLRAERVTLDLGSGSQATVQATETLKADLSSGSSATYSGHPQRVEKDLSSGSTLEEE